MQSAADYQESVGDDNVRSSLIRYLQRKNNENPIIYSYLIKCFTEDKNLINLLQFLNKGGLKTRYFIEMFKEQKVEKIDQVLSYYQEYEGNYYIISLDLNLRGLLTKSSDIKNIPNRDLDIIQNNFIQIIAQLLNKFYISTLDLTDNMLKDDHIKKIAPYLSQNSLESLKLSSNNLTSESIKSLKSLVKKIGCLDISNNQIDDSGLLILVDIIRESKSIRELDIRSNKITQEGEAAMIEAVNDNFSLTKVDLCDNLSTTQYQLSCKTIQNSEIQTKYLSALSTLNKCSEVYNRESKKYSDSQEQIDSVLLGVTRAAKLLLHYDVIILQSQHEELLDKTPYYMNSENLKAILALYNKSQLLKDDERDLKLIKSEKVSFVEMLEKQSCQSKGKS